jgi:hypothetical protein
VQRKRFQQLEEIQKRDLMTKLKADRDLSNEILSTIRSTSRTMSPNTTFSRTVSIFPLASSLTPPPPGKQCDQRTRKFLSDGGKFLRIPLLCLLPPPPLSSLVVIRSSLVYLPLLGTHLLSQQQQGAVREGHRFVNTSLREGGEG